MNGWELLYNHSSNNYPSKCYIVRQKTHNTLECTKNCFLTNLKRWHIVVGSASIIQRVQFYIYSITAISAHFIRTLPYLKARFRVMRGKKHERNTSLNNSEIHWLFEKRNVKYRCDDTHLTNVQSINGFTNYI